MRWLSFPSLLLKDLGADARTEEAEYEAAGRYFAGGNWEEFSWYADQVMEKVKWFE